MTDTTNVTVTGRRSTTVYQVAQPKCFVEIYTFEGGKYQLESGNDLAVTVNKNINETFGTFQVTMPPSGPNGPNTPPDWTQVITPMSFVVIGMRRGIRSQVTMLGIVLSVSESEIWQPGAQVQKGIVIQGKDFGHYFSLQTYYSLWFLGATGAPVTGGASTLGASNDPILGPAFVSGRPDQMAAAWFNIPMAGPKGVFAQTYVPYKTGHVKFPAAIASWFQEFDAFTPNGFTEYLISSESTWIEKFRAILPYPWYEFFVITARAGYYPDASGGTNFISQGLGQDYPATPVLVARVNPLPVLTANIGSGQFDGIDAAAWNALDHFTLDGVSFTRSSVGFDESAVLNFFTLNPTYMGTLFGQSNSLTTPYIINLFPFSAAGDSASIQRYGFRPANGSFNWLADQSGGLAQSGNSNDKQFIANLMARFASTYEPMALMARGEVTTFLRPDIMPGNVFTYRPFKNDATWDFYIDGISHQFLFGGETRTTLTLSRGLPSSVYADQAPNGLLYHVHTGNAERLDGIYQARLPAGSAPPLQPLDAGPMYPFFAGLAKAYVTPQPLNAAP